MTTVLVERTTWGAWPSIRLSTEAVQLEVVGELGGRVVSIRDRRRDREWLVQASPPLAREAERWSADAAVFGPRESFGWDECLPTTARCADPLRPDGPPLRDHGDQWGRATRVTADERSGSLQHTWESPRWTYRFTRQLTFTDPRTLLVEYSLTNLGSATLPIHWAQHPVLALEPGSYLDLPDVDVVCRTWQHGIELPTEVEWPIATTRGGRQLDLACVRGTEGWAAVLYAHPNEGVRAVAPDGARLDLDWDRQFAPALRVWLAYGGWPPDGPPAEQVALEPCTSAHDHLAAAIEAGAAPLVQPGGELGWWVRLALS